MIMMLLRSTKAICVNKSLQAVLTLIVLTASRPVWPESFSFSVTSDVRQNSLDDPKQYRGVCEAIAALGPGAFMTSPGDFDPAERILENIRKWIGPDYPWYPGIGNHELPGQGSESSYGANMNWLRHYILEDAALTDIMNWGPPGCIETTYSFDYQNAHFIMLNEYFNGNKDTGTNGDVVDALYNWLKDDLARNDKPFILIFGHEPAFPQPDMDTGASRHNSDSLNMHRQNRDRFWRLLSLYGVAAYFCGHTHIYNSYFYDGVWQMNSGQASGESAEYPSTFLMVNVEDTRITFQAFQDHKDGGPYILKHQGALTPGFITTLIPNGADWQYLDDGSDQGTNWREMDFDDSQWKSAPAPLGYGNGTETTTIGYGGNSNSKHITTYFRHVFWLDDPAQFQYFSAWIARDDGALVYLNGHEIFRTNLQTDTVNYKTRTDNAITGMAEENPICFQFDSRCLTAGSNIVAIELHQCNPTSSDLFFNLELNGHHAPGSIADRVWEDTNKNGQIDNDESGLASVRVFLLNATGDTLRTIYSDSSGCFRFYNLQPGTFWVDVDEKTLPVQYQITTMNDPYSVSIGPGEQTTGAGIGYRYNEEAPVTLTYYFPEKGWACFSLPGRANDMRVKKLFPDFGQNCFYADENQKYVPVDVLQFGNGYWVYVEKPMTARFEVFPLHRISRRFQEPGWYLIGSVIDTLSLSRIVAIPSAGVIQPIYEAAGDQRIPAQKILPQHAYWLLIKRKCDVVVGATFRPPPVGKDRIDIEGLKKSYGSFPPAPPPFIPETHEVGGIAPQNFSLKQNYPNPFNGETCLTFTLQSPQRVLAQAFNISGALVRILADADFPSGENSITWDGRDDSHVLLASGIYVIRLETHERDAMVKVILAR
jgi:predicted phosphodiesterase